MNSLYNLRIKLTFNMNFILNKNNNFKNNNKLLIKINLKSKQLINKV
jgi:hypothetical protein